MKIVCGLGNPGREYERHRHNVGFMVLDALAKKLKAPLWQSKFDGELVQVSLAGDRALLLKPQTFMNASGTSLGAAARFYKVGVEEVLVVHDELDLPFGKLALKKGGGSGGHNGLNSIAESWGELDYARLRFGIGKPQGPGAKERVIGHVLGNFSQEEATALGELVDRSVQAIELWARDGLATAMNRFNKR
jgi:PTH1 family peptidyl-tRNA hydrolase